MRLPSTSVDMAHSQPPLIPSGPAVTLPVTQPAPMTAAIPSRSGVQGVAPLVSVGPALLAVGPALAVRPALVPAVPTNSDFVALVRAPAPVPIAAVQGVPVPAAQAVAANPAIVPPPAGAPVVVPLGANGAAVTAAAPTEEPRSHALLILLLVLVGLCLFCAAALLLMFVKMRRQSPELGTLMGRSSAPDQRTTSEIVNAPSTGVSRTFRNLASNPQALPGLRPAPGPWTTDEIVNTPSTGSRTYRNLASNPGGLRGKKYQMPAAMNSERYIDALNEREQTVNVSPRARGESSISRAETVLTRHGSLIPEGGDASAGAPFARSSAQARTRLAP